MSTLEVIFIVTSVINVFSIILIFLTYISVLGYKTQIHQMHTGMATVLGKLFSIEHIMSKMGESFTEFIKIAEGMADQVQDDEKGMAIYKTTDGKYTARTVEELINKIKSDSNTSEYFTDEELDKLKKLFSEDDDLDDEEE